MATRTSPRDSVFVFERGDEVEFIRAPGPTFTVLSRFHATSGAVHLGEALDDGSAWRPFEADPRDIRKVEG